MNLLWLEDFLALTTTGNFSRAAAERNVTQPAFGRRIKALEEWLGVELFDRSSQPVRMTSTGEWHDQASPVAVTMLAAPGPVVVSATPSRPLARAQPSAA